MNVKKVLAIVGVLSIFSSTTAFATTGQYFYRLTRGGPSKYTNLVTKDDGDPIAYVTATSNSDWNEGEEGYYVRVRDKNDNPMTSLDQLGGPIYNAGSYTLSYDLRTGRANAQYRLWASYNDDQPYSSCYAIGRWTP